MFNSKKDQTDMSINTRETSTTGINSLGNSTTIEGNLTTQSDIRLDGNLVGNLICKGKLILGPKGSVKGDITCDNAVVEGKIEGTIRVKDHLHVKETAKITGEISTNKLTVASGAIFNVKCEMGGQTIAPKAIPQVKTA